MKNKIADFISNRPILTLFFLIMTIGLICFFNFFSLDDMFVFTGLASDSYTSYLPNWFKNKWLSEYSFLSTYSFYDTVGNSYIENIPLDPLGFVTFLLGKFFLNFFGVEGYAAWYFYSKFFVSFLGTGIFTYLWLYTVGVRKFAAISGGVLAAFSGAITVLAPWNIEYFGFYTAFYLFSFEQLFLKKRWYFFVIAAAMLAGKPYFLYLHSFFLAVYVVFRFFVVRPSFKTIVNTCIWIFCTGLLGILINLPDFVNSLIVLLNTPRMEDVNFSKYADDNLVLTSQMAATTVLRFFANNILGNDFVLSEWNNYLEAPAFYSGIISILIFPQIFQFLSRKKIIAYSCLIVFVFSVVYFPPLRRLIVLYAGDYYRYGIDFFVCFVLIFLSAESLMLIVAKKRLNFPLFVSSALVSGLLLWMSCANNDNLIEKPEVLYFVVVMLVAYVLLFCFINYFDRQNIKILILLLVLFEVTVLTKSSFEGRETVKFSDLELNKAGYDNSIGEVLNKIHNSDSSKFYRVEVRYNPGIAIHSSLNSNMVLNYYTSKGYNSFNNPEYVKFLRDVCFVSPYLEGDTRWINGVDASPFIYGFLSSKYLITKREDSLSIPLLTMLADTIEKFPKHLLLKNNYVYPLGFTLDKYISRQDFLSLVTFSVNADNAKRIMQALTQNGYDINDLRRYISGVEKMIGMNFSSLKEIDNYVEQNFDSEIRPVISSYVYVLCSENARQLYSLLNCFVPDSTDCITDFGKFQKVSANDSVIGLDYLSMEVFKKNMNNANKENLEIKEFKQFYIKGNVNLSKDKFMVFSIPFDESWKIFVDGIEKKLVKCDIGFCGLELSSGSHTVELFYKPQNRNIYIVISIISTLIFWGLFFVLRMKNKKQLVPVD